MSKDFALIADDVVAGIGALRQGAPEAMKAFGSLAAAATATRALDTKTKELMALAVYMGGGPAAVFGADALRAYDQFSAAKAAT